MPSTDPRPTRRRSPGRRRHPPPPSGAANAPGDRAAGVGGAAEAGSSDDGATDDESNDDFEPLDDDLDRPADAFDRSAADASTIAWSATPPAPSEPRRERPRRSGRRRIGILGWGALIVAGLVAVYLVFSALGSTGVAVRETPTPVPTAAPPTATPLPPTPEPTVAPTVEPSVEPTAPGPTGLPAEFAQRAFDTLQSLIAAAKAGDVVTAQTFLGDTASGLRASGLRRAALPVVASPAEFTVVQDATGYLATLNDGVTRLTSLDGQSWTFDWGNLPLAAYRTSASDIHDLWWQERDGKHFLHLAIAYATLSKETLTVQYTWTFDPERPNDATYFKRSELITGSLTFDGGEPILLTGQRLAMVGVTTVTDSDRYSADTTPLPREIKIGVTVTNPKTVGGDDRAVDTTFLLSVR